MDTYRWTNGAQHTRRDSRHSIEGTERTVPHFIFVKARLFSLSILDLRFLQWTLGNLALVIKRDDGAGQQYTVHGLWSIILLLFVHGQSSNNTDSLNAVHESLQSDETTMSRQLGSSTLDTLSMGPSWCLKFPSTHLDIPGHRTKLTKPVGTC